MEPDDIEAAFNAAFPNVAGFDYATRFQFALPRLEATENRSNVMPIAELTERLSLLLGRNVTTGEFVGYAQHRPEHDDVLEALARALEVGAGNRADIRSRAGL